MHRIGAARKAPMSLEYVVADGLGAGDAVLAHVDRAGDEAYAIMEPNPSSLGSQLGGGIEDGTDDLVVAGAPAEVAGEPVARLGLRRVRIAVQQRLGSDQQARRAEAALQRCMFQKFSLQRMQIVPVRHALNSLDRAPFGLHRKHQARADQATIDGYAAG